MLKIDKYETIAGFNEITLKEKGSVFIAQAYPVEYEEDIVQNLEKAKKKYYDASHHCYAYKLLGDKIKYSDAGEPSGTAGIRILNALNHFNLQNTIVIVIRYFGGTKLGVGPLGRAYYNSAVQILENSQIVKRTGHKKILFEAGLNQVSNIYHLIGEFNGKITGSDFSNNVKFECMVSCSKAEKFESILKEILKGGAKIITDDNIFFI